MSMMMLIDIHNEIKKRGYRLIIERGFLSANEADEYAKNKNITNYAILPIRISYYIVRKA